MLYDKRWSKTDVAPAPVEPWRKVLLNAADILERDGWCQRLAHQPSTGRRCAAGAMARVCTEKGDDPYTFRDARQALEERIGQMIFEWNDDPGRTAEEVIATMREVARS